MGKYFGTDGFRGEANKNLTVDHAFKIGRFLGWYYGREHKAKVVIGKDTRRSSYMFENALCAGLTASGADAYLLHVTSTPSVSFIARADDFDCGIMISASHNPFYDNGIKLLNAEGEKMEECVLDEIEEYLDSDRVLPLAERADIGCTVDYAAGRNRYLGYLISLATRSYKGFRVGLDCANGSTWMMAKSVFDALGADTHVIANRPDGLNINVDCGIMISASHNPYYDNGIKLLNAEGEKMEESVLDEIEAYLDSDRVLPLAERANIGCTVDYAAGRNRYIGYLISLATRSYKGFRVGLDCANGSTWMMAKSVFDALGADTHVIANRPDGLNINVDCGSTHIEQLQKLVVDDHLDVGFAFDGDADRCLAVDEKGNVVNGDHILYVCAKYMQDRGTFGNSKVVTTIMSNMGLYKALDALDIGYEKTAVGDKYVAENMREHGHLIGGEQSGHIIFGRLANTGDGILTAIKVMEAITETKMTLGELAAPMVMYPQKLKNVVVTDKDETLACEEVKAAVKAVEEELGSEGRVVLRKSGTEPLLRVMVEATSQELCEEKVDQIIDAMRVAGKLIKVK